MTTIRNTFQVVLSSTVAKLLFPRATSRTTLLAVPTTAVNVWVGASENVTKTTGFLVTQSNPFDTGQTGADPTEELWCISDSGTPSVACYEDKEQ